VAAYPQEWERHLALPDGTAVFVRPLRADDEPLYAPFVAAVSAEDARLRFFGPVKEFDHAFLSRLLALNYVTAMAFIALDEATGAMLGVARLHNNATNETGEFAIIVRSDLKSHGLGWQLMQLLIAYGRWRGLGAITGLVLRENAAMLKMCAELGFAIDANPRDPSLCDVRLQLRPD